MKRLLVVAVLALLGVAGVFLLSERAVPPSDLTFTPVADDARGLVERMLQTNQPWLRPKPLWARYNLQRSYRQYSLSGAFQERSLRRLYHSEAEKNGPFTAAWRAAEDLRLGAELWTPLHNMLPEAHYSVQMIGASRYQGQKVVAVDITFDSNARCAVGMGAGTTHFSQCGYGLKTARLLMDPARAIPLFIGTSRNSAFGARPRFESTWTFSQDFFRLDGGRAPRRIEWQMPDAFKERLEFQVTRTGAWIFKKGSARGGMSKSDRWSGFNQRVELVNLQTEELRPGDLLQQYPSRLTGKEREPIRYGAWQLTPQDTFCLSHFSLDVGNEFHLSLGQTDLGIGYGTEGAYWAVLIPRETGTLVSQSNRPPEEISHVLLRFQPQQIGRLFPRETVSAGDSTIVGKMCGIANLKTILSWPAGAKLTIPKANELIADTDTTSGARRFFQLDTAAGITRYIPELETLPVQRFSAVTAGLSEPLSGHEEEVAEEAGDASRPKVVAVFPPENAASVPAVTKLRVRFDRPMDPMALNLNWECGGFTAAEVPAYDPEHFEFTIPIRLAAGTLHQVVVNKPLFFDPRRKISESRNRGFQEGFASADRRLACLFVWRFVTAVGTNSPTGTSPQPPVISPPPGSHVPLLVFVDLKFEEPMATPDQGLPYIVHDPINPAGLDAPQLLPRIEYDPARFAFRIPVLLPARPSVRFSISGFRTASGLPAAPVALEYAASGIPGPDSNQRSVAPATINAPLVELLAAMKQKHAQLTSLAERVQELSMGQREGLFTHLRSTGAAFKWLQSGECYGDVSDTMGCAIFRIGSDGHDVWSLYGAYGEETRALEICPAKEVSKWDFSFCDPFELSRKAPEEAAAASGLSYGGLITTADGPRHILDCAEATWRSAFSATFGELSQWAIDPETCRPIEVVEWGNGSVSRKRFLYDTINKPLSREQFSVPKLKSTRRESDPLDAGYTNRFVKMHDGSGGAMSLRLGKYGPKGTSSGGLN